MISDILRAIEIDGATISEIRFKTYVSYQHLKKYLTCLVQNDLIFYTKTERRFRITQRGLHALDMYTKMDELLVRNTSHKNMETTQHISSFP
jgi:predicted transcriptional regulator